MNVYLGTPRGFCAGVVMAIDVVEIALERFGAPVYMKHQIVHNPYVVDLLEKKGAITVEEVDEIPADSVVVFSAHGSPPEDFEQATARDLHVLDATCPLVTKVHNEAKRYDREGRKLILVGHKGHQEVKGTMGHRTMHLIDDRDELEMPDWSDDTPVAVLTQTTLSVDDTRQSIEDIESRFSDVLVRNDLCYATTNRQLAVKELCKQVDLVLVIGAPNSSNCNRLREVAEAEGVPAHLLNGPEEMRPEWFDGVKNVGVTSGASTPEELVRAVIDAIDPAAVLPIRGAEEDVRFKLPKVQCCELHTKLWYA
jgi:4-hydroxy-3-methylbut-2-enyl diphosphate reductase